MRHPLIYQGLLIGLYQAPGTWYFIVICFVLLLICVASSTRTSLQQQYVRSLSTTVYKSPRLRNRNEITIIPIINLFGAKGSVRLTFSGTLQGRNFDSEIAISAEHDTYQYIPGTYQGISVLQSCPRGVSQNSNRYCTSQERTSGSNSK